MGSSTLSIGFFFAFMALTLVITYWAARRTRTTEHFFAAGGQVTPWQNGWALAGDFLSAAALLGIAGIVTSNGFDGMIYSIGWLVGWPIILFLIVEPLRNVGRFTFADVVAYRLRQRPVRLAGAVGTLAVILFYLIAQMVATGSLIKLLFGLPYTWSVVVVGSVMLVYVLFGGMLATTWVQVVKAALLMGGGDPARLLVLTHFDMNPLKLFAAASEKYGTRVLQPGSKVVSGQWDAISLGLGLMFGTAAMPHVLMRAYTVKDAKAARLSILYATGLIGVFHLMVFIIGFGAMVLVGAGRGGKGRRRRQHGSAPAGARRRRQCLLRLHLRGRFRDHARRCRRPDAVGRRHALPRRLDQCRQQRQRFGGRAAQGGARRDRGHFDPRHLPRHRVRRPERRLHGRPCFSIACAANFPSLVLAITWRRFTTPAAVASILVGTLSSLVLIYLSPTIQVDILGKPLAQLEHRWWFVSLRNPAIISMPLSFSVAILLSLLTTEKNADPTFEEMQTRILLGPLRQAAVRREEAKTAA